MLQDACKERFDFLSVSHLEYCHWLQMKAFTRFTCMACYLQVKACFSLTADPAYFQCYVLIPHPNPGLYTPKPEVHLSAEQITFIIKKSSKSQIRVCTPLYSLQANLEPGNTTMPCSAPGWLFLTPPKVQLTLPLLRGQLVQLGASLSWEVTT